MSAELLLGLAVVGLLGSGVGALGFARHLRTYPLTAGYLLGGTISLGLVSLGIAAYALGEFPGGPSFVLLVLINLVVQPLCLLLFAGGAYKMGMALRGRVTYAFRTAPPGQFRPQEYRALLTHCILSGAVGAAFSAGLAYVCLRPLL
jgi:hypothetical protein